MTCGPLHCVPLWFSVLVSICCKKETSVMRGESTCEDLELGKTGERQHAAFVFLGLGYLT